MFMSKKRTKADRLQRNVERLEKRDDARPEKSEIDDQHLEPTSTVPAVPQLEEQIRQRAYELYEERGGEDGYDLDDWLRAEEELTQKARTPAA